MMIVYQIEVWAFIVGIFFISQTRGINEHFQQLMRIINILGMCQLICIVIGIAEKWPLFSIIGMRKNSQFFADDYSLFGL